VTDLRLRNVRPWPSTVDTDPVDVVIRNGLIASIGTGPSSAADVEDGHGAILLPAFTDAHTHLDSTRLGLPFRPHSAGPTLAELIQNDLEHWRSAEASVAERATFTLGKMISNGATRVRSHAQIDPDSGLERLEGILAARDAHHDRCTVQIVAFPQTGIAKAPGTEALLAEALSAGADLIGGLDPEGFDGDTDGHLDIVFGLAHTHDVGVDIHLHDRGEPGARQIEQICRRATELSKPVTISHCFALATVDEHRASGLIEMMGNAGVSVATVAPGHVTALPLLRMIEAGVGVGLGQDGIRDYWSPYGTADMLDRTWQLAFTNGFRRDDHVETCVDVATRGGASIMGVDGVGLAPGDIADLVVVPGESVTAAVMDRAPRSLVIRAGRVVARSGQLV